MPGKRTKKNEQVEEEIQLMGRSAADAGSSNEDMKSFTTKMERMIVDHIKQMKEVFGDAESIMTSMKKVESAVEPLKDMKIAMLTRIDEVKESLEKQTKAEAVDIKAKLDADKADILKHIDAAKAEILDKTADQQKPFKESHENIRFDLRICKERSAACESGMKDVSQRLATVENVLKETKTTVSAVAPQVMQSVYLCRVIFHSFSM